MRSKSNSKLVSIAPLFCKQIGEWYHHRHILFPKQTVKHNQAARTHKINRAGWLWLQHKYESIYNKQNTHKTFKL